MAFHRGQEVVCVKAGEWLVLDGEGPPASAHVPHYGEHFLVNSIHEYSDGSTFLTLIGCSRKDLWAAEEFRPVKTTDISLFHQMLAPSPKARQRA